MGQKSNPILIRLSQTNEWKSKYYEKKLREHPVYLFKDLEMRRFIYQYFKNIGIAVHQTKLCYHENSLHIFISYYASLKSALLVNQVNRAQKLRLIPQQDYKKKKTLAKRSKRMILLLKNLLDYQRIDFNENVKNFLEKTSFKKANLVIKNQEIVSKIRRTQHLKYHKDFEVTKRLKTFFSIRKNSFIEKFLEALSIFLNKKFDVFLTLRQLNKDIKQTLSKNKIKSLKRVIIQLRKYRHQEFFKEGINSMLISMTNQKSAGLLAEFMASQIKKLKRHNPFLKFVKTTLALIISNSLSPNIKGIRLKIKGRFNGAPRAKHKIINIGSGVPVLTIDSKIDYSEVTSYTANGTIGIKIWVYEKPPK